MKKNTRSKTSEWQSWMSNNQKIQVQMLEILKHVSINLKTLRDRFTNYSLYTEDKQKDVTVKESISTHTEMVTEPE